MKYVVEETDVAFEVSDDSGRLVSWFHKDSHGENAKVLATHTCSILNHELERRDRQWRDRLATVNDELQPMRVHLSNAIRLL